MKKSNEEYDPSSRSSASTSSPCSEKTGYESSEENIPIPTSLIGANNYLTLTEGKFCALTKDQLSEAINQCKILIVNSVVCSSERKWLVRRLIELRYQLMTIEETQTSPDEDQPLQSRIVVGHHLKLRYEPTSTTKRYCDTCCSSIWVIVQSWYQCTDCRYRCHIKCVDQIVRTCAHIIAAEKTNYETSICPEVGLTVQDYQCAECKVALSFKDSWLAPRLCDYTGLYYCTSCHWNNMAVIPARVARNWDFKLYRVCRASYQLLKFTRNQPFLKLEPRLYGFVNELANIKRLREEFSLMKRYLAQCRNAKAENKAIWKLFGMRAHLLEPSEAFSLADLTAIHNHNLLEDMGTLATTLIRHITNTCVICSGKGYRCELCQDKDDVLFPFSSNVYICSECSWVYHKTCWMIKNTNCTKCERKRRKHQVAPYA